MLIQQVMGGIGFITLVFFMTFMAFAMAYSWRQFFTQRLRDDGDDLTFRVIDRYASTRLFKLHVAVYIAALVIFVPAFLFQRLG